MCPIRPAEKRLEDGVKFWEKAYADYFKPERFRLSLQAAIQSFRSVTFVLQAQKSQLPNFDTWYETQQGRMRSDPKMRWLVEARNFIEKQGDLTTRSRFTVTLSNSWEDQPAQEYPLGPEVTAADVAKLIANTIPPARVNEEALLRFDRQWIDSLLPEEEVLSTLIHCYGQLRSVLRSAHDLLAEVEREKCHFHQLPIVSNEHLPRAMLNCDFPRVAWFKLKKNKLVEYERKSVTFSRLDRRAKEVKERYPGAFDGFRPGMTFREECDAYFNMAKQFLVRDGHHVTTAILGFDGTPPQISQLRPADRADQHVLMRELASQCIRLKARYVILVSEAWRSAARARYRHAADDPQRSEALVLHGLHVDGTILHRAVAFSRDPKGIRLAADEKSEGGVPPQLSHVHAALQLAMK